MRIKDFLKQSNWTQGQFARDEDGNSCDLTNARAVKFCILGAAHRCYPNNTTTIRFVLQQELGGDVTTWNDAPCRTFADVRALVERLGI